MSALSSSDPETARRRWWSSTPSEVLTRLYALADVTLIGGSLIQIKGIGGHNPLEPAAFAKPILFGHHMHNFREIARMLIEADGAIGVADACALQAAVAYLVKDRHRGRQMGQNARRVFDANKGAVSRTVAILADPALPPTPNGTAANLPHGMIRRRLTFIYF